MASFLGMEFGETFIRAVEVEGSARKPQIKRFHSIVYDEPGAAIADPSLIGAFLKQGRFTRDPSCVTLDSRTCVFREIDVPFTGDDQIRKVIKYEAEGHLPQSDIDEMVIAYRRLGEHRDKSHLMVMAAPKRKILERLSALQSEGVDPLHVDLDLTAMANTVSALGLAKEHESFAVVDCNLRSTNLLFFEKGELISTRSIRLDLGLPAASSAADHGPFDSDPGRTGGQGQGDDELLVLADGEDELAARDQDPRAAADRQEVSEGEEGQEEIPAADHDLPAETDRGLPERDLPRAPAGFLSRLDREVRRTLAALRLKTPLEIVYLTGPGAPMGGVGETLAGAFETECEIWRPLDHLDHKLADDVAHQAQLEIGAALGAALKLMGHDSSKVDFRQEECGYARKFDQIKVPLTCLAMMVLILVLLLDISQFSRYRKHSREMQALGEEVRISYDQWQDIEANPDTELARDLKGRLLVRKALSELTSREEDLRTGLGRSGAFPSLPSALEAWAYLANAIDKEKQAIGPFIMEKLDITVPPDNRRQAVATVSGILTGPDAYSRLEDTLRNNGKIVTKVNPAKLEPLPDRRMKFERLELSLDREALIH